MQEELDDIDLGIDSVNHMLQKRGLPTIESVAHYRRIMRFPIIDYYRDLGFDLDNEDYYSVLAPEWVALYMAGEESCGMMAGVVETLQALRERGIPQIMLSASNRDQLLYQLGRLGIEDYFDEILGLDNIFAKSKTKLAEDFMQRNPEAVPLCIGDTDHDAALAKLIGADVLLYTGGHQDLERLSACGCPIIDQIPQILEWMA